MTMGRVSTLAQGEVLVISDNFWLDWREILNSWFLYPGFLYKPQLMPPVATFIN